MAEQTPFKLLPPEPWQRDDIDFLKARDVSAQWSEMGCKKTTTGLWFIKEKLEEEGIVNPSILIITTRSGKGTFFQFAPRIMEDYTVFDLDSKGLRVWLNGMMVKIPKLKYVPQVFEMPSIVVTHYHTFSRSNYGKFKTDPETGEPLKNENGGLIMEDKLSADYVTARKWDFVWLDECHRIKDKDTRWTVAIKRVKARNRHVSTGTGFINRPHEIWSSLNFLDRKTYSSFWAFYDEFCEIDTDDGYSRVVGVKPEKKDEFRALVRSLGPRRTLDEVMPHIKQPLFQQREVTLNPIQRKMYDSIKGELYALDQQGTPLYAANVLALLQRLRAICVATPEVVQDYYDEKLDRRVQKIKLVEPSSKLDEVMEILDGMEWDEEAKQPVVIFSNFLGPLHLLQARFDKANSNAMEMGFEPEYPYLWLKESDNDDTRYNKWAKMFPSMQYRVFMSTLQIGGESINLTPARHVIFLDRSWSPKDNMQGIGRIRRPGQEGQPIVININATNTVDQYIQDVNELKQGWFKEIFGVEGT